MRHHQKHADVLQDVAGVRIPFGYGLAGAAAASGSVINVAGLILLLLLRCLLIRFDFANHFAIIDRNGSNNLGEACDDHVHKALALQSETATWHKLKTSFPFHRQMPC